MKKTVVAAFISAVFVAAGLGHAQTGSIEIAIIGKSRINPVFEAASRGAQDKARALSAEYGLPVTITVLTPDREDADLQTQGIQDAVNLRLDAILIAPTDAARVTPAIDRAVEAGLLVMTFDNDAPNSKRFAHYGANDMAVGEQVMTELAEQIGATGKVALLAGNRDAENLQMRVRGVQTAADRYPGIELIGPFYHEEKAHVAASTMLQVNGENPDLKGWALVGGWPLFRSSQTVTLVDDLTRRKLKVVSVDALPEELLYVEKGLAVLLAQLVYDWGAVGVQTIFDRLQGGPRVSEHIEMKLVRVGPENLVEWATRLRSWGFRIDPSAYQ